ncbi:F0F1 ATP synthase subunit delta [Nocardioides nematodiphilus]|uniref:F0F1 ATP synthase subunit delta n=1 Tax=Nocardioides nematodiphilus TaxID=2849669 RepID=UPI001CDA2472|nr:F0F1 ATP synthase subunit delta [Nocardioides nematodiphilus]MCA1982351.1 F0F1 ATP synthase subunit delta [Nocardioides nematodiphilus]
MDVRGASADAVASLTSELETTVSGSEGVAAEIASSLFSASQTLRAEGTLRRFLTDQAVAEQAKSGLVQQIFGGKLAAGALTIVISAVTRRWTHGGDLPAALEHLSEIAVVRSAGSGDAKRLSDELFGLRQLVQDNAELRDALSDPSRSVADKSALLDSLLGGKVLAATATLAKQALAGTYRTVSVALNEYQKVAAAAYNEGVATVRVAKPLGDAETSRLAAALERQYGRPVHLNVLVDPAVVGGIKVEIGDDVIDGTVASRLDDARRLLAG